MANSLHTIWFEISVFRSNKQADNLSLIHIYMLKPVIPTKNLKKSAVRTLTPHHSPKNPCYIVSFLNNTIRAKQK